MKVGIIGGGMMGLASAFYLSKAGIKVVVLEKDKEIGGLSRSEEIMPDLVWDRFYHVILTTDNELLNFIEEIGLSLDVKFRETRTGFYTDGQLYSMSNTLEFLRFKPLSLWDKLRLGTGILYASKINNPNRLEKIYAKTWLIRIFGRRNYEKLWDPLLRSKLGTAKTKASGAFIWAIIKRYYGTRHKSSKKELMGCVSGGYFSILNHLRDRLLENGVKILSDHGVERIDPLANEKICLRCRSGKTMKFDKVVATVANPEIIGFWPNMPCEFRLLLEKVDYLSLVCVTLVLKKCLSPFYITNLTDPGFPFTGIIESTHVIPREVLVNKALIYLPRYMAPNDPFIKNPNEYVVNTFLGALKRVFPDLSNNDVIAKHVHREHYVQPIQDVGYSGKISPMKTPLKNFYMVNTTMILNSTLNNNQVIKLARNMANLLTNQ